MNEQRQQAYLDLIDRLLKCPSGEEPEILQANQDLLDADFLLMLEGVAEYVSQQGDENVANWLRNLANQLREALNLSSPTAANTSEEDLQAHLQFLMEVLQAMVKSRGDAQVIYPLLANNTQYLNLNLAELLRHWATSRLAEVETDVAQSNAAVIHDFSNVIQQFPLGNKASNMEIAIASYEAVLTVYTRDAFPQQWAATQNNLGAAYSDRILGEKAQNIEQAIASYKAALEVYTRDAFPQQWATTQNNLGNAYRNRILGDKAQNLEQAIASFRAALEVTTRQAFPQQWATTQNNLGAAYRNRILGDKAQNLEQAIASFTAALEVYTRQAFLQQWATTQNNLGAAYSNRILGDKAQNLEQAIASFTAALEVRTRQAFSQQWAGTQNNLGAAYSDRILGDKAQNLEQALASYTAALEVYTRDAFPQQWAGTQNNMGTAYSDRILGDKAQNLEQALASYTAALEVYTRQAFPQNHADISFNLGIAYQDAQRLDEAYTTFKSAIETVELLRGEIVSGDESKYKQAEEWNSLYRRMVEVCLELKKSIQFYIFGNCFRAFIITRHKEQPEIWQSEPQDLEKLHNWIGEYLQLYSDDKQHWRFCLNDQLSQLAKILHIQEILELVPPECKKVIFVPHLYLHLLPLHALPLSSEEYFLDKFPKGVSYAPSCQLWRVTQNKAKTLSDSPFRHLFAIQNPTDNLEFTDIEVETIAAAFHPRYILKKNEATAQALKESPNAEHFRDANWLHFSCHGYFNFNLPEKSALQLAASESPLPADAETSRYLRVSENAGIDLKKCLILEDIFQLSLPNCRLVTLSACETGLVDGFNTSDEYVGLPSGFIRAGAASIVSSLWAVDDFSTALLMIKFYENLQTETQNVSIALNSAQRWFRQVTQRELLQWLDGTNMEARQKEKVKERLEEYDSEHKPFEEPAFWAAFCAVGE
jgi:CHAT domain-containing protein